MSSMLPVIVLTSLVALLCGVAHFVLRAWHLRRTQTAEAYQVACREAGQLLRRCAPRTRSQDSTRSQHRHFELGEVPLELRRTLLDGLQILAAHAYRQPDDENLPASLAGPLQELQGSLEVVRTIAQGKVAEEGREALRALFVDAAFAELQSSIRALDPASATSDTPTADLADTMPAAREALAWKQDGLTVSHEELTMLLGDAQRLLREQKPNGERPPTAGQEPNQAQRSAEDASPNHEQRPSGDQGPNQAHPSTPDRSRQ